MTIIEYYQKLKKEPRPSTAFVLRMTKLCHRNKLAVMRWCTGKSIPDKNIQEKIAADVGIPSDELFDYFPENFRNKDNYGKL